MDNVVIRPNVDLQRATINFVTCIFSLKLLGDSTEHILLTLVSYEWPQIFLLHIA